MNKRLITKKSKFLSLILRHKPEEIGIVLDDNGWANISEIIQNSVENDIHFTMEEIEYIVENSEKKRFLISYDRKKIRANQGHSISVDVELKLEIPKIPLFHGTATKHVDSIMKNGINAGNRLHVHLSDSKELAQTVGSRHGKAAILVIDVDQMVEDGLLFYLSENGVWLTEFVAPEYIAMAD